MDWRRTAVCCAFLYAALCIVALTGCDEKKPAAQAGGPPVTVANPTARRIAEWDDYTGRFQATEYVEIRARVNGYLDSIHFTDGQIVKKGDLLFVIDPRPYQATADSDAAALTQTQARLDLANREQVRAAALAKSQNGSVEALDKAVQEQRAAGGAVQAAQAELRRAQLDLEFTHVTSPVTGRISRHLVSLGNLVSGGESNSTLLTTIVSLDPIYFYFDADQNAYLKYTRLNLSGQRRSSRDVANPVRLALNDEKDFPHQGHMDFVDNQIDFGTGTIRGRAVFDNADLVFTPGMFGRIQLIGEPEHDALLLPDDAIGTDQARRFVYVVGDGNVATAREVVLGPVIDGLRVVRSGVAVSDRIIVNGLQRVRVGQPVTPQPPPQAQPKQAEAH
ncbi:MAG TPA: efflux RND transporter periplasmic adaptor subunit [Alphaproteobacteria bacterium]|jgi:RND family efflux transporter MFP subunit|nr:efflux RND transporter periplasmic adaptor subunit [Alphaproteobacteria bacterium]